MSGLGPAVNSNREASALRQDLHALPLPDGRGLVIVDEIGGRFARTTKRIWQSLQGSDSDVPGASAPTDATFWPQAKAAGWLKRTSADAPNSRSRWLQSPLSFRIPLASIDPVARRLVPLSGLVFSPLAVVLFSVAGLVSLLFWMVRWQHWAGSVPSLQSYLMSLQPLTIAATFVLTKTAHELGHAVLCRRFGSRCGVVGIWWLCFMPCPYVDVTDVWRQPNAARRGAVMAAGIWVEWIIAMVALWVWWLAPSHEVRMTAMNVVLVCGISTVLFNANPLMRYDGYFILSDLLDTANLREEARRGLRLFLVSPLSRWHRLGKRVWSMAVYHLFSKLYRISISIAIATFVLQWAAGWGLWRIAMVVVALAVVRLAFTSMRNLVRMIQGSGAWRGVPGGRRVGLAVCGCLAASLILIVPIPRYRHVTGVIRVRDAALVYLPRGGVIQAVDVRVGDRVVAGQKLAEIADPSLQLKFEANRGKQSVIRERVHATRLASLRTGSSTRDWQALEAASDSLASNQSLLQNRIDSLRLVSPQAGVVLPASAATLKNHRDWRMDDPFTLRPTVGETTEDRVAWCRVASDARLEVVVKINASDRNRIAEGVPVSVTLPSLPGRKIRTQVRDVSPMELVGEQVAATKPEEELAYEAVCDFSIESMVRQQDPELAGPTSTTDRDLDGLLRWDGASCEAVLQLPPKPLWKDAKHSIERLMGI
ncbi:peptidase M50 [Rhodopirellula sp. P2]|uniref:peptidase M50 n=1 Tax=Rhodopirellula sp. P2 TaxID=2127060 RepID=UPI0023685AF4|nr:peptidase M50 [Rhodopirellula sp. P2]WDQ16719.1 peptidase M50 [Rhodopirellula sp. P2]